MPFNVTASMTYHDNVTGQQSTTNSTVMTCLPGDPAQAITLASGVAHTGMSGALGAWQYYKITVPANSPSLVVSMSGGTGDADLYVRRATSLVEAPINANSLACGALSADNIQSCTIANPAAGDYYLLVIGYAAYSGALLTATIGSTGTPGFTLSVMPQNVTIVAGGSATFTVTAARSGGFTGDIDLSMGTLPTGVTGSMSPATLTGATTNSTVTLTASASAPASTSTFTVTGSASGQAARAASAVLNVSSTSTPSGTGKIQLVHSFDELPGSDAAPNGKQPTGIAIGSDGNIYGTTYYGGLLPGNNNGHGIIFRLTYAGEFTKLYTFENFLTTGEYPRGLLAASDGNLYGMTGDGSLFRLSTSGTVARLSTSMHEAEGSHDPLVQALDGSFYGVNASGGTQGRGSVFRITSTGAATTITSFNGTNGQTPIAGLVQGSDGRLYGTTSSGGAAGNGTVFTLTPGGSLTTLVSFANWSATHDPKTPLSRLAFGPDGALYGTSREGGTFNSGSVFRITTGGALSIIHSFNAVNAAHTCNCDPYNPEAGLLLASDGNFYGTTVGGKAGPGEPGDGSVYRISPAGVYSLVGFMPASVGYGVETTLVEGRDGYLYGITRDGGPTTDSRGTVFRVDIH
jgi:uncharacterized repeat protein (TIGR03803 family)